jgi:hypothetical protein
MLTIILNLALFVLSFSHAPAVLSKSKRELAKSSQLGWHIEAAEGSLATL